MEKTEPKAIGELLKEFLKERNMTIPVMEGKAKDVFRKVAGEYVSKYVEDVYVRNGVLYITVSSAVVKHEIHLRRRFYIKSVNDLLGGQVVRSIFLK